MRDYIDKNRQLRKDIQNYRIPEAEFEYFEY